VTRTSLRTRMARKTFSREYIDYIDGPGWADRKARYYARHPKRCRACGATWNVQLHHLRYLNLGNEPDRDLMPLCRAHHERVDTFRRFGLSRPTASWLVVLCGRLGF
jgi:hypothetical protein